MVIQVCVGSSCYLKGSADIVELLQKAIADAASAGDIPDPDEIALSGSFCIGKCNRVGVTVQVDDEVHIGITRENFKEFFSNHILAKFKE